MTHSIIVDIYVGCAGMANNPKDSGVSLDSFFARRKLPPGTRDECDNYARTIFPSENLRPAPFQGYCSYTVIVGSDKVVQFRPPDHGLDIDTVSTACDIFGEIAPRTKLLGTLPESDLRVYCMRKLAGVSLSDLCSSRSQEKIKVLRRRVVRDFARLQATSWRHRRSGTEVTEKGTVGRSLQWRIDLMASRLPDRFRKLACSAQQRLKETEGLPWIMSHGDFIPANILVSPETGRVTGLLDWAEAEWLPFGVGMYGLEELLGEDVDGCFQYYPEAGKLRALFWRELLSDIPELSRSPDTLARVREAQVLGVLLWHGIAFDDGRLDRVVEEGVDDREIQRLDAFVLDLPSLRPERTLCEMLRSRYVHLRNLWLARRT